MIQRTKKLAPNFFSHLPLFVQKSMNQMRQF
jgi:hypothetical protein